MTTQIDVVDAAIAPVITGSTTYVDSRMQIT
jgi:hypothetical protein